MKQQKKIHRIFVDSELNTDTHICSNELSHRIMNVLRIKENNELVIFNRQSNQYLCSVKFENKIVKILLKNSIIPDDFLKKSIHLAVSVVSMKIMDLIIQKSVELGVDKFYPVYTSRSQYKDIRKKISHWQKIIIHATEQSGRCQLMKIQSPLDLDEYVLTNSKGARYVLHQSGKPFSSSDLADDHISFFIGPEGGFENKELTTFEKNKWKLKRISVNILRTETACISALTLINNYESLSRHSL